MCDIAFYDGCVYDLCLICQVVCRIDERKGKLIGFGLSCKLHASFSDHIISTLMSVTHICIPLYRS